MYNMATNQGPEDEAKFEMKFAWAERRISDLEGDLKAQQRRYGCLEIKFHQVEQIIFEEGRVISALYAELWDVKKRVEEREEAVATLKLSVDRRNPRRTGAEPTQAVSVA
ncbi:hypothetical protein ACN47E_001688 [Coniothyrium glycines]